MKLVNRSLVVVALFSASLLCGAVQAQETGTQEKKQDDAAATAKDETPTALNFKMTTLEGKEVDLSQYKGNVVLIVNTASKCGLTPQYKQLQELHNAYADKGLKILGFPCNQFGKQEPGTAKEIQSFCVENYGVKFDMFSKVDVNGENQAPLFKYLNNLDLKPKGKGNVQWNFEKFVLDRNGNPIARFSPRTKPDSEEVLKVIKEALGSE